MSSKHNRRKRREAERARKQVVVKEKETSSTAQAKVATAAEVKSLLPLTRREKHPRNPAKSPKRGFARVRWVAARTWAVVVSVGVVLGIVGFFFAYLSFVPYVSIAQSEPLSADPFTAPFIVHNESFFSVYDVEVKCNIKNVEYVGENIRATDNKVTPVGHNIKEMVRGAKAFVQCDDMRIFLPIKRADVDVVVTYQPSFYMSPRTQSFTFNILRNSDGKYLWFPNQR